MIIKHLFTRVRLLTPKYLFSSKLDKYASIRQKNLQQLKRKKNKLILNTHINPEYQSFQTKKQYVNTNFGKLSCEGCSATLQSKSLERYGYIEQKALSEYIKHNSGSIQHQVLQNEVNYQAMRQLQDELGIKIIDPQSKTLEQINDINILLKLEQKIEILNKERQTLLPKQYKRKELYCRRCFYLKYHNQLPDEHNSSHNIITQTNAEQLLDKIFSKKQQIFYLYLIDIFDISGTLTKIVLQRLFKSQQKFILILTKADVVNKKYMNYVAIKPVVRDRVFEILQQLKKQQKIPYHYKLNDYLQDIYMLSNANSQGFTKLKKKVEELTMNVQLIGYPNTGKTSLLNLLTSAKKPTSTVPGTSLSFEIGKFNKIKIFDCPGFYNRESLYNLIQNPNERKKLTWKEPKFAPGILTNSIIFFGGMLQIQGVRVIVFGHGGAKSVRPQQANEWLLTNYDAIWSGLPKLSFMQMKRYQFSLDFVNGQTDDLQIAGYGFIGFKLCRTSKYMREKQTKKLVLYLPEAVSFTFRKSLILNNQIHNPASIKTRFQFNQQKEKIKSIDP